MIWAQNIADPLQGAVIQHQRAQTPLLRFEGMRQEAVCGVFLVTAGRRSDPSVCPHQGRLQGGRPSCQILPYELASKLGRSAKVEDCRLPPFFPFDALPFVFFTKHVYSYVTGIYQVSSGYLFYRY